MGVVMEKLPHPYKLTHKITKKMEEAFRGGFPREREREERETFFKISKAFFYNFLTFFYFSPYFSSQNFIFFHKNEEIGDKAKWGASQV